MRLGSGDTLASPSSRGLSDAEVVQLLRREFAQGLRKARRRKRKAFLEQIKAAVDSERPLYCFFYGVTPELKQVPSKKNPQQTFGVFSADIQNLDHLLIREAPGLE